MRKSRTIKQIILAGILFLGLANSSFSRERWNRKLKEDYPPVFFGGWAFRGYSQGDAVFGGSFLYGENLGHGFCIGGNMGIYGGVGNDHWNYFNDGSTVAYSDIEFGVNFSKILMITERSQLAAHVLADPEFMIVTDGHGYGGSSMLESTCHANIKPGLSYFTISHGFLTVFAIGIFYNINLPEQPIKLSKQYRIPSSYYNGPELVLLFDFRKHHPRY